MIGAGVGCIGWVGVVEIVSYYYIVINYFVLDFLIFVFFYYGDMLLIFVLVSSVDIFD